MSEDLFERAELWPRGHLYEDFRKDQEFDHHWGRTVTEADNTLFSTLTISANPLYFNREYARAHDHRDVVVNPLLVFNIVFGLSVEDLSEAGGPFLGVFDLTYHEPVYPGDTLTSKSTTLEKRVSKVIRPTASSRGRREALISMITSLLTTSAAIWFGCATRRARSEIEFADQQE